MIEINIQDNKTQLEEFKVERNSRNEIIFKTCIILNNISRETSNKMKDLLKGTNKTEAFGRFKFQGSVSFNINDFYITLHNVDLSGWSYEVRDSRLKINFKPLEGFGYLSGMGLSVLRDEKLKSLGII